MPTASLKRKRRRSSASPPYSSSSKSKSTARAAAAAAASAASSAAASRARARERDVIELSSGSGSSGGSGSDRGGSSHANNIAKGAAKGGRAAKSNQRASNDDEQQQQQQQQFSGYNTVASYEAKPMNDTKLCGTHKLITLESARYSIRLVAEFMKDEQSDEARSTNVSFKRSVFDPLWQRLKDQGSSSSSSTVNKNSWRYEPTRDPLSMRNWAFVPPRSKSSIKKKHPKGKRNAKLFDCEKYVLGKDYYLSEEHVVLSVLEDISTLEEVTDLFAENAHCFMAMLPVLDRAVTRGIEYKHARGEEHYKDGKVSAKNNAGKKKMMTTISTGDRSCSNESSFGPYELSSDEMKTRSSSGDDDEEEEAGVDNQDECAICFDGGELICCDGCDKAYHAKCLQVNPNTLPDPWHCPSCLTRENNGGKKIVSVKKRRKTAPHTTLAREGARCKKKSGDKKNGGKNIESKKLPAREEEARLKSSRDENKDECDICGDGGDLLCCDFCDKAYHPNCIGVDPNALPDQWLCPSCVVSKDDAMKEDDDSDDKNMMPSMMTHQHFKSEPPDSTNNASSSVVEETGSNLSGVEPKVNMPIEIRDKDFIWNVAKIIAITSSPICSVTVRYEGWGPDWDETVPYPNKILARIFTYTKKVKCFLTVLGGKAKKGDISGGKNNWTDAWPCKVSFRMPHPGQNLPCDFLRLENHAYVQPYLPHLLPRAMKRRMVHGGQWVSKHRLKPWKNFGVNKHNTTSAGDVIISELFTDAQSGDSTSDLTSNDASYCVRADFCHAYKAAQSDWIRGKYPPNAMLEGVLLKEEYRVHNVGGDAIDGVRYSGALHSNAKRPVQCVQDSIPSPATSSIMQNDATFSSNKEVPVASKIPFVPAPSLPPPIPITDTAYPNQGVRRLPNSDRWSSILRVAGNDLFLGSYTSQSEAAYAVRLASMQSRRGNDGDMAGISNSSKECHLPHFPNFQSESPFGPDAGKMADLFNTRIESIVSALEEKQASSNNQRQSSKPPFRIQDWMAQHHRHAEHLKEMAPMSGQRVNCDFNFSVKVASNGSVGNKRRKQAAPKRLVK